MASPNKELQLMNEQYPIGEYTPLDYSRELKTEWLIDIRMLPDDMEAVVAGLREEQTQIPYRQGGWTVHQLVRHVADSHMNAYCRFKLGYTESNPAIRTYEEKLWAETADVKIFLWMFRLSFFEPFTAGGLPFWKASMKKTFIEPSIIRSTTKILHYGICSECTPGMVNTTWPVYPG